MVIRIFFIPFSRILHTSLSIVISDNFYARDALAILPSKLVFKVICPLFYCFPRASNMTNKTGVLWMIAVEVFSRWIRRLSPKIAWYIKVHQSRLTLSQFQFSTSSFGTHCLMGNGTLMIGRVTCVVVLQTRPSIQPHLWKLCKTNGRLEKSLAALVSYTRIPSDVISGTSTWT